MMYRVLPLMLPYDVVSDGQRLKLQNVVICFKRGDGLSQNSLCMEGWHRGMALIAHICDIHVGARIGRVFPEDINRWWQMMLEDWRSLPERVELALVCGDVTSDGTDEQFEAAKAAIESLEVEAHLVPGSIDIAAGKENWIDRFGEIDKLVKNGGLNILLVDVLRDDEKRLWSLTEKQFGWLSKCFDERVGEPFMLVFQPLLERREGLFRPPWDEDAMEALFERLRSVNLICILCSGMHSNREGFVDGKLLIGTGALCGFRITETPPERCILTRPGYRLIALDGIAIRTFWREITSRVQVTITFVGGSHTLGPRPLVNMLDVYGDCTIYVQAYARDAKITSVEIGLGGSPWLPMRKVWDGIWSEWEGTIRTYEIGWGQQLLVARARASNGEEAYDAIPFWMRSLPSQSATAVREAIVYELLQRPR
ncbi:MAG: hypothetical protein RMK18_01815 [Armatimonadota bacterium]|nr:hypothetical protein [Armatimonadota bacterium]MCX7776797.1 hypothetical protein [Armatimonadota bacterium]MDW8024593.1 hypothetical protein [Armatimonadota bacterium]